MEVVNITLDETPNSAVECGIHEILRRIRPAWSLDKVVIKDVKGGRVNRLISCSLDDDLEENDVLLVRIYGRGVDGMTDREKEILTMRIGYHVGLAAPIYCRFNNGIVYKYQRGKNVDFTTQTEERVARGVAKELARMHLTDYKHILKELGEDEKTDKFHSCFCFSKFLPLMLSAVPDSYEDMEKEKVRRDEFMRKEDVLAEVERLDKEIEAMNFTPLFCHNDLNTGNILFDRFTNEVHFIDWEFVDLGQAINDLASYFFSHVMNFEVKCSPQHLQMYPDKEYQLKWIRWYLEYTAEYRGDDINSVNDNQLHVIYKGVNLSVLRNSLCMQQWCLGQDANSSKEHDYFALAKLMQGLYRLIQQSLERA